MEKKQRNVVLSKRILLGQSPKLQNFDLVCLSHPKVEDDLE